MAIMLRREELILGRQWPVDFPHIENSPVHTGDGGEIRRDVCKWHQGLALGQRGQRPFRDADGGKPNHCETSFEQVTPSVSSCHGVKSYHKWIPHASRSAAGT